MHDRQVYDAMTAEQDHDDWRNEALHVEELKQTGVWSQSSALLEANEKHGLMLKCGRVASDRQDEQQHA